MNDFNRKLPPIGRRTLLAGGLAGIAAAGAGLALPRQAEALEQGWRAVSGQGMTNTTPLMVAYRGRDYNFVRGNDRQIYWNHSGYWEPLPGISGTATDAAPTGAVFEDKIWLFHVGTSGQLAYASYSPEQGWGTKWMIADRGFHRADRSVAVTVPHDRPNELWLAYVNHAPTSPNEVVIKKMNRDGRLSGPWRVGYRTSNSSPAITTGHSNLIHVAWRDDRTSRLRAVSFPSNANMNSLSGLEVPEISDWQALGNPQLFTDNSSVTRLFIRGLDTSPYFNTLYDGRWVGWSKYSGDRLISTPGIYRNQQNQVRVYGAMANPYGRIHYRPF